MNAKGIVEALKDGNESLRVLNGDKWLIWDEFEFEWVVYEHKKYAKKTTINIRTSWEYEAIEELLK